MILVHLHTRKCVKKHVESLYGVLFKLLKWDIVVCSNSSHAIKFSFGRISMGKEFIPPPTMGSIAPQVSFFNDSCIIK